MILDNNEMLSPNKSSENKTSPVGRNGLLPLTLASFQYPHEFYPASSKVSVLVLLKWHRPGRGLAGVKPELKDERELGITPLPKRYLIQL